MGFGRDLEKESFKLSGPLAGRGFDCWRHFFNGTDPETGETRAFFIEFYFCNRAEGAEKPVMGQRKPHPTPSYLMVNAGSWGRDGAHLHKFYGWKRVDLKDEIDFDVTAGGCYLSQEATRGYIRITEEEASGCREAMTKAGTMSWSLVFEKRISFGIGPAGSRAAAKTGLFRMLWHAGGLKTAYKGDVLWNGRRYIVKPSASFGYADKLWGSDFALPLVSLSSSRFKSKRNGRALKRSAFAACLCKGRSGKTFPVSALSLEGRNYRFSSLNPFCRSSWNVEVMRHTFVWHFSQKTLLYSLKADVVCRRADMLPLRYEKPGGGAPVCIQSGGNGSGRLVLTRLGKTLLDAGIENVRCGYAKADENI